MAQITRKRASSALRKRDSQRSRRRLIEAGIDVFAKRGPEAATVDEICRKAGINKRMVYYYFGGKKQLYEFTLGHMYEKLLSLDISLQSMMLEPEKLLESIIRQYHTFLRKHRNFVRLICYENLYGGKTIKKLRPGNREAPVITAIQLALEKGKNEHKFRQNIDVKKVLITIMGMCFFYFSNEYTMKELVGDMSMTTPGIEKQIKHILELLLNGIKTK